MGYILKTKDSVKLFYEKPIFGYYANDIMAISVEEYIEHSKDYDCDNFVYMEKWCDVTESVNTKFSFGFDITDTFLLECILVQTKIEDNIPYEIKITKN